LATAELQFLSFTAAFWLAVRYTAGKVGDNML